MNLVNFVCAIFTIGLITACGGPGNNRNSLPPVFTISVAPESLTLTTGYSVTLTATPQDASGKPLLDRSILWSSGDSTVATVSEAGLVNAIKAGNVEIKAAVGAVVGRAQITVVESEPVTGTVTSIDLTPPSARITEGDSIMFTATPRDANSQPVLGRGMRWTTLDPDIAQVDPGGLVTALKSGATRVDVSVDAQSASAGLMVESDYDYGLLYSVDIAVGASQLFTLDINDPTGPEIPILVTGDTITQPAPSPDGSRIAFVMLHPTETAIYVADRDGSNSVRITTMAGTWDQPAWSADGARIAFRGRLPGQDADIWTMAPNGTDAINLTDSHGPTSQSSPAWSQQPIDGMYRIAYSHSENAMGHLWTMRADGSDKQQVTSSTTDYDDMPDWSPDGSSIVFVRSAPAIFGDLYLVAASGGAGRSLTPFSGPIAGPQLNPRWSPDGKLIAFSSAHVDGIYQIYTVWSDGTRLARRTTQLNNHFGPRWLQE